MYKILDHIIRTIEAIYSYLGITIGIIIGILAVWLFIGFIVYMIMEPKRKWRKIAVAIKEGIDLSEEFIRMCEEAKELKELALRPKARGSFSINSYGDLCMGIGGETLSDLQKIVLEKNFYSNTTLEDIWLPQQHELQDILSSLSEKEYFKEFYEYAIENPNELESTEQLWLDFTMRKKYGKTWDEASEEWVKEEDETF